MDDHHNIERFDDNLFTKVRRLGQGHFGIVELCSYEPDPNRKGFGELVAVKRKTLNHNDTYIILLIR